MNKSKRKSQLGFTLIEMLVIVMIIGIVTAIATPAWLGFLTEQRLNDAQTTVFQAMRQAQNNARRDKQPWMVAFRNINIGQSNESSQFVVLSVPSVPGQTLAKTSEELSKNNNLNWQPLPTEIRLVRRNEPAPYSTLPRPSDEGPFRAVFASDGTVPFVALGRVVVRSVPLGLDTRSRCVIVSTLIGSLRSASDQGCLP